ncbi:MAG: MATE family efflux transporter [Synergistaceae bacterium]|jgi:putative MATE family efflux protein|nr:MATE family efflux transporter [Synergistaceae bacterium]
MDIVKNVEIAEHVENVESVESVDKVDKNAVERQAERQSENRMGVTPVHKLLLSMSIPMVISMLVQALYNVVDSIFVAQISENALTAISLAFPIQSLMIAVGVGTGVGINSFLSRSLGEKNFDNANKAAANGMFLAWASCAAFMAVGALGSAAFFRAQTNIQEIVQHGQDYLSIICIFSFGMFNQITLERLLMSTGKSFYAMVSQSVGAVINIVLDPVMIFGLWNFPKMGVAGAAYATVIGQSAGALLALYFNLRKNHEIKLWGRGFRPNGAIIKRIYAVGLPSILMASLGSVMTYGINSILISFTATAAAVFGVYFKLQSFVFMPVFGVNNGMVPILAFNFGAKKKDRITQTIKIAVMYAVGIMSLGIAAFQFYPDKLLALFNATEDMLSIGIPALRIISIHYAFAGFCIVFISVFQALGNGLESLFIAVTRQLILLLPMAWLLSLTGNVDAIWWSFPAAECFTFALSAALMKRVYNKRIKNM